MDHKAIRIVPYVIHRTSTSPQARQGPQQGRAGRNGVDWMPGESRELGRRGQVSFKEQVWPMGQDKGLGTLREKI